MLLHTLISIYIYNYAFYYFWLTRSTRVNYYLLIEITYLRSPYACELSTAAFCVAPPPYALSARSSRRYPVCTHVAYLARSAAANSNLVYLSLDGRALQPLFAVPVCAKTESRRARKYMCTCTSRRLFAC